MFRISIFFIQLLAILTILTYIFSNPFTISLDIGNLKYSFSSNLLAGLIIVFLFIFFILIYVFFKSRLSLTKYFLKNKYKKIDKGYFHFVEAMIAVANKDNKSAIKSHKKMNYYLKDDPSLSLLLKSEVYKIEGNFQQLTQVYESMLKSKKTQTLGYRGLMEQNLKNQDFHHAFLYGEKLFKLNPTIDKLYETLIYIAAKTNNWNQMIIISENAYSNKIINKQILNENKSIAFFEIAKIKFNSSSKDALSNISKALELKKNFPPYLKFYFELLISTNKIPLLKKMIIKYWSLYPSSILRTIITDILVKNNLENISFINKIIKNNLDNEESKKLLIYFSIRNKDWETAKSNITGLIGSSPTKEICLFMADIELLDGNDKQKSDAWIMRSETAPPDNIWICKQSNRVQENWTTLSNSGHFNSLVWTQPKMLNQILN